MNRSPAHSPLRQPRTHTPVVVAQHLAQQVGQSSIVVPEPRDTASRTAGHGYASGTAIQDGASIYSTRWPQTQAQSTATPQISNRVNNIIGHWDAYRLRAQKLFANLPEHTQRAMTSRFVPEKFAPALLLATKNLNLCLSVRETGELSVARLQTTHDAPKPHTLLEKSIKLESLKGAYGEAMAPQRLREMNEMGLAGAVGHWRDGELRGIYIAIPHGQESDFLAQNPELSRHLQQADNGHLYLPLDLARGESVEQTRGLIERHGLRLYTGDLDLMDLYESKRTRVPSLADERIVQELNQILLQTAQPAALDCPIQHGPQVNYMAYGMDAEGLQSINAQAANLTFPLLFINRGAVCEITDQGSYEAYMAQHRLPIKHLWREDETTYRHSLHIRVDENNQASLRRRPSGPVQSGEPARRSLPAATARTPNPRHSMP